MHIVIDTTPLIIGHKTRGIGRYTRNLVEGLRGLDTPHRFTLTSDPGGVNGVDVIHYPYFELFQSHLPFLSPSPHEVVTIHDLIPLRFPEVYKPGVRSGFNLWLQTRLIRRVSAVITDSHFSATDIVEFLSFPKERIFVVPLGVDSTFHKRSSSEVQSVRDRYHLPRSYVLYVGDVNVNKNLSALIEAVAKIPSLPLVLVSQVLMHKELPEVQALHQTIEKFRMADRVTEAVSVPLDPVDDLAAIYSGATAYVQPSLCEGFGLPLLEAMACKTPTVAARSSSLPEVAGDAALFSGTTPTEIHDSLVRLLSSPSLQETMKKRGMTRAELFTWRRTAQKTLKVYELVCEQKQSWSKKT